MSDLTAREAATRDGEPIVELVEEGRAVGYVYVDDDVLYTEFLLDEDGEPWAFEVSDLQTALDTARAMLLPEGTAALTEASDIPDDAHPVDRIAAEFDERAVHRAEEDEGFYPPSIVAQIIQRCEQLGIAVVSLEGFRMIGGEPASVPGLAVDTGAAHDGEPWPVFIAGCNVQAMGVLEKWAREPGLIVALEVGDDDGERYVL
jgi:hypothetical protein